MDLLDSILSGMEKPPTVKKPDIKDKEKKEKFEKMVKQKQEAEKKQKEMINKFRVDVSRKIRHFVNIPVAENDVKTYELKMRPMGKFYRSIVRETCDEFEEDVVVHSFGVEEEDRHCIIWKRGYEPCEDEIKAMKLGIEYKPKGENDGDDEEAGSSQPVEGKTDEGKDKFWSKYEKIIGENASGLESARVAAPAKQYGCVPIDKKKDQRSIEQMMDDIRKSKRQKTSDESQQPQQSEDSALPEEEDAPN